jgi:hypothetical protein
MRNGFHRFASSLPGGQAAHNHERVESVLPQHVRHPGAGRLARSSTVDINVFVLGQSFQFLGQVVWLETN